jgi:hypothetical protein
MKTFSAEEIAEARTYLEDKEYEEVEATVGGRNFRYFVVDPKENDKLPNFVMRLTGENTSDGSVYGISSAVRPEFRQYAVFHEFIEFSELGINVPGRCRTALDLEMNVVPEEIKSNYVVMRTQFFKDLIVYARNNPEYFNDGDLMEMKDSLSGLEALV